MEKNMTFDLDLAFLRNEHRLSQRELATRMGIAQPSLKQIEDNFNDIKISSLKRYINALGMTLTIKATSLDGKSSTYLLKESAKMKTPNSFFEKIESDRINIEREAEASEQETKRRKEIDKKMLQFFRSEADKLSEFIKEKLQGSLTVIQSEGVITGNYYKTEVLATKITFNETDVYLHPTGPRFGSALGRGVIEIHSNSKYFNLNPYITLSLILKDNKDDVHWVIHKRNTISGEWKQERLDENSLYSTLEALFFQ